MAVISSSNLNGFLFQQALHSTGRLPVELNIVCLPGLTDQSIGVDARAIYVPVILWNTDIIKQVCEHVQILWMVGEEVQNSLVLLNVRLWVWYQCMNHIREFHSITNEKYREVVSNQIKISLNQQ